MLLDEAKLIEKPRLIEALFSGATTEGERVAAERARQRILDRLESCEKGDPPTASAALEGDVDELQIS